MTAHARQDKVDDAEVDRGEIDRIIFDGGLAVLA